MSITKKFAKATPAEIVEINRLIAVAQTTGIGIDVVAREDAILLLIHKFQYLIRKIAKKVWRSNAGIPWEEWEHDATTTFIELLVDDFQLKENGGSAGFTHYMTTKLFFRILFRAQRTQLNAQREFSHSLDDVLFIRENDGNRGGLYGPKYLEGFMSAELREALLNQTCEIEEEVLANMAQHEINERVVEVMKIVQTSLDERERKIFGLYFCSGYCAKEIGPMMEPQISKSRVTQIAARIREKIQREFGRQYLGQALES